MFSGHLDVDLVPVSQKRDPWKPTIEGDLLYGHGIGNMKAGVTSFLMAMAALKRIGFKPRGDIIASAVVGELQGGVGTKYLIEHGVVPDLAIVTEPTYLNVRTFAAGCLTLLIDVTGRAGAGPTRQLHNSISAIDKTYKIVQALKQIKFTCTPREDLPALPCLNVGGIIGGMGKDYGLQRPNMVPDFCTITVDIHGLPDMTPKSIKADIEKVLQEAARDDPDLHFEIEMPPGPYRAPFNANKLFMPANELPIDDALVQTVRESHKFVTGKYPDKTGIILPHSYFGNDGGHLAAAGAKALTYGPSGPTGTGALLPGPDGTLDQHVSIYKMVTAAKVLAAAATQLAA
jgi:acetylornithine deacetylase/succinyl-diaminopimelate desuccinylase-like protein